MKNVASHISGVIVERNHGSISAHRILRTSLKNDSEVSHHNISVDSDPPSAMLLASLPLFSTIALFLVFSSNAKPIVIQDNLIRLPFAKKVNITSPRQLVTHDRARAAAFFNRRHDNVAGRRRQDVPAIDSGTYYAATVTIGTPGTSCKSKILIMSK